MAETRQLWSVLLCVQGYTLVHTRVSAQKMKYITPFFLSANRKDSQFVQGSFTAISAKRHLINSL
jgi:hypothetical protein